MQEPAVADYPTGLKATYVGELVAERLYRALARRAVDPLQREKFELIADAERLTAHTLAPIARRLAIELHEDELALRANERLTPLAELTFEAFVVQAAEHWPPYIAQFERLASLAPREDSDAMRLLLAHERALVRFVELERASPGERRSLQPLKALLALMPRVPSTGA